MVIGTALGFSDLGTSVLLAEAFDSDEPAHDGGHGALVVPAAAPPEAGAGRAAGVA